LDLSFITEAFSPMTVPIASFRAAPLPLLPVEAEKLMLFPLKAPPWL
jgi:hypothetical protein